MKLTNMNTVAVALAALALTISGCKKDEEEPTPPGNGGGITPVTTEARLSLTFTKGEMPFAIGDQITDGDGRSVRITKLRFFISGVEATDDADQMVAGYEGVYLLADASGSNDFLLGNIEGTHVHELHFHLGVDSATNHGDMTTYTEFPLNDPTTTWMWNPDFGYKFIDIEGDFDEDNNGTVDAGEGSFQVHAAGDDLFTHMHAHVHTDIVSGEVFIAPLKVDVMDLLSGVQMTGATHMDLQGTAPRTIQIMANLAAGIHGAE